VQPEHFVLRACQPYEFLVASQVLTRISPSLIREEQHLVFNIFISVSAPVIIVYTDNSKCFESGK